MGRWVRSREQFGHHWEEDIPYHGVSSNLEGISESIQGSWEVLSLSYLGLETEGKIVSL